MANKIREMSCLNVYGGKRGYLDKHMNACGIYLGDSKKLRKLIKMRFYFKLFHITQILHLSYYAWGYFLFKSRLILLFGVQFCVLPF